MIEDEKWQGLLAQQSGVVTRAQALDCGWHPKAVDHRAGRSWQRLLRGVLLTSTGVPTREQELWACLLRGGPGAALTGCSGLAVWGLHDAEPEVHVAVPWARQLADETLSAGGARLVVHRTTRPLLDWHPSLPTLSVARCVTDACLDLTSIGDVRAIVSKAVQRRRTTVALLEAELELAPQRGSGLLRQVLAEVGEGARSAPEAALASALKKAALPPYQLNVDAYDDDGTWLGQPDVVFALLKLAVEVDGERWHITADRWVADVERHTRMEAAGWTVLRYTASRVLRDPDGVVREIQAVVARLSRAA